MRKLHRPSLLAVAVGVWMILAPVVYGHSGGVVFAEILLGSLLVGAGMFRALNLRGARMAGVTMVVVGVATFLLPWIYPGLDTAGRWNGWVNGLLMVGLGLIEARPHPGDRPAHGLYVLPDFLMREDPEKRHRRELRRQQRRIREAGKENPPKRRSGP